MEYAYYPGCSLSAAGRSYEESIRAVAGPLGLELKDVDDWNCCGATAYMSINESLAHCLSARNLAMAARQGKELIAPCSACYTNLRKTRAYLEEFPELRRRVVAALAEGGVQYTDGVPVRHMLDVVTDDVGLERVSQLVKRPLEGLRVAPYYGCQIVRPLGIEDDPDDPTSFEALIEALGAEAVDYPLKVRCCGGSLIGTREEVALRLCRNLLLCAEQMGADLIAVTCPLCQMNLDAYQSRINRAYDTDYRIPILYFTQLMGMAFGVDGRTLGLHRGITPVPEKVARLAEVRA
jgi:heterodisulfide reductase subunit B